MKSNYFCRYLFYFSLLILFFDSMYAYFLWNINTDYLTVFVFLLGILYHLNNREVSFHKNICLMASFLFLASQIWAITGLPISYSIMQLIKTGVLYMVLILPVDRKKEILKLLTTSYGVIMGCSLVAYLLWMTIGLPSFGYLSFNNGQYEFINHLLYILPASSYDLFRFNSIFLEPGHVAMIASYLLFANEYDFRHNKFLIPILLAIIFSLSLAGYILTTFGYCFFLMQTSSSLKKIRKIIIYVLLLISVFYLISNFNSGLNVINEVVLSRLELDAEKGIVGNNRFSLGVDMHYDNAVYSGEILTGLGAEKYEMVTEERDFSAAGYKVYMLRNGVIGTILIFLFYYLVARSGPYKRKLYLMLLLYALSFLQRAYPEWWAWILPFVCCGFKTRCLIKE